MQSAEPQIVATLYEAWYYGPERQYVVVSRARPHARYTAGAAVQVFDAPLASFELTFQALVLDGLSAPLSFLHGLSRIGFELPEEVPQGNRRHRLFARGYRNHEAVVDLLGAGLWEADSCRKWEEVLHRCPQVSAPRVPQPGLQSPAESLQVKDLTICMVGRGEPGSGLVDQARGRLLSPPWWEPGATAMSFDRQVDLTEGLCSACRFAGVRLTVLLVRGGYEDHTSEACVRSRGSHAPHTRSTWRYAPPSTRASASSPGTPRTPGTPALPGAASLCTAPGRRPALARVDTPLVFTAFTPAEAAADVAASNLYALAPPEENPFGSPLHEPEPGSAVPALALLRVLRLLGILCLGGPAGGHSCDLRGQRVARRPGA